MGGIQKYVTKHTNSVIPAIITAGKLTVSGELIFGLLVIKPQIYNPIIEADNKKEASQIRRCQKRLNAIGFICPPYLMSIYVYYDVYGLILQVLKD